MTIGEKIRKEIIKKEIINEELSNDEIAKIFVEIFKKISNICSEADENKIKEILMKNVKPTLSEAERVILENIDKDYKWIAKDRDGTLYFYSKKPTKLESFWENTGKCAKPNVFNHLFQFITWQDNEPYNIEKLLKGE